MTSETTYHWAFFRNEGKLEIIEVEHYANGSIYVYRTGTEVTCKLSDFKIVSDIQKPEIAEG